MNNPRSHQHQHPQAADLPLAPATAALSHGDHARAPASDGCHAPSSTDVATMAYFSYLHEGCPQGRDVQHWLKAERQLRHEHATAGDGGCAWAAGRPGGLG